MKKQIDVNEIGQNTINLLQVKHGELKYIWRCYMTTDDKTKAKRLEVAILRSIDHIRRAMIDDETL